MIIDTENDARFKLNSAPNRVTVDMFYDDEMLFSDNDLLDELNSLPVHIGWFAEKLVAVEAEIEARGLLEPAPAIELDERTDDWLAERRAEIRKEIATLSKQQKEKSEQRDEIEQEFFRRFSERGTSGTRTSKYTMSARQDDHYPEVQDRTEFEAYLLRTGKIHLLQKRLALTAIREELDAMKQEREVYEIGLEEADWHVDACRYVLTALAEEAAAETGTAVNETLIENKLKILERTKTLKSGVTDALDQHYDIPGVGITTKLTLNQVKRG